MNNLAVYSHLLALDPPREPFNDVLRAVEAQGTSLEGFFVSELCVSAGCSRKQSKFGHCARCLQNMEAKERVKLSSIVMPSGCWEWCGTRRLNSGTGEKGYGIVSVGNKQIQAHRFSYSAYNGDIPEDAFVLHKCDNKPCVNPEHLELGDRNKNIKDAYDRGLIGKASNSPHAKLSTVQRQDIVALLESGKKQCDVATTYHVAQSTIGRIWALKAEEEVYRPSIKREKSSKHKGISWHKASKKWIVFRQINNVRRYIGRFTDEDDAYQAYLCAGISTRALHNGQRVEIAIEGGE